VVKVLTDPTSAGLGGRPDEPLLAVQKLALDETDAIFGAFEPRFLGYASPRTPGRGAPSLSASAVGWRGTTGLPCTEVAGSRYCPHEWRRRVRLGDGAVSGGQGAVGGGRCHAQRHYRQHR
ncbi:unnamed protein product, partial [Ectocarpus sp. 4 AP-2014]